MNEEQIEATREVFEERMFSRYFISNIGAGLKLKEGVINKAEFCARDGDDYVRPEISAMWFGWKEGLKYKEKNP